MSAPYKIDLDSLTPKAPDPAEILPIWTPIEPEQQQYTELGLGFQAFGRYPRDVQYFLKLGLEYNGLPLDENRGATSGTVPEMVFFGMLLSRGFKPTVNGFFSASDLAFIFQSEELGGRQPGGAVADFVVYYGGLTIAVRVQSAFHSIDNPFFVGGQKVAKDEIQRILLAASPGIDRLVDVNRPEDNNPLERGPIELMNRDMERVLYGG